MLNGKVIVLSGNGSQTVASLIAFSRLLLLLIPVLHGNEWDGMKVTFPSEEMYV